MKLFIDTDIIIDLFAQREPFYNSAAQLFTLIENKKVEAFTTPVVLSNLFYILGKYRNQEIARTNLRKLRTLIAIISVDSRIVDLALNSSFKDFEDAIQYYAAKLNNLEFIITRNIKDFPVMDISIITAEDFIRRYIR